MRKARWASDMFQIGEKVCGVARLPPRDYFASRKMADPRALALYADARSLWGLSRQAVSRGCPLTLSTQALQLTLGWALDPGCTRMTTAQPPPSPRVFLSACVDKDQQPAQCTLVCLPTFLSSFLRPPSPFFSLWFWE